MRANGCQTAGYGHAELCKPTFVGPPFFEDFTYGMRASAQTSVGSTHVSMAWLEFANVHCWEAALQGLGTLFFPGRKATHSVWPKVKQQCEQRIHY